MSFFFFLFLFQINEKRFSFWGSLVYRHVAKVMIISLLIAGVLIAGMYRLETEERVDHLWVYDKGWALPVFFFLSFFFYLFF